MNFDHVARGAGMQRHDRSLAPRQAIEQRRLAGVRRAGNRNRQAFAQAFTLCRCAKGFFDFGFQRRDLAQRRCDKLRRHVTLVGEIDPRLNQRRRLNDLLSPALGFYAEQTFQMPQRLTALTIGVGMNQIVETFGFGEIELAVLESAARELPRLCRTQAVDRTERIEHRRDDGSAAMNMKFRDVFAGRAVRTRKPEHDRFVDGAAVEIAQGREMGNTRCRQFSTQPLDRRPRLRTGHADDGNRRRRAA